MPGAPAPAGDDGGGVAEAISQLDAGLSKLADATAQNPKVPDGAKAAMAQALEAFRSFTEQLTGGGEAGPQPAEAPVSAEGGPRGVPMSMGRPG